MKERKEQKENWLRSHYWQLISCVAALRKKKITCLFSHVESEILNCILVVISIKIRGVFAITANETFKILLLEGVSLCQS